MHGAVVTVKVLMVKHVEVVATAWPLEAVMALQEMVMLGILMRWRTNQPGAHGTVDDDSQGVDRVQPKGDGDEGSGVVERGLNRVHVCPGEGCGVVGLVVQGVDLAVKLVLGREKRGTPEKVD